MTEWLWSKFKQFAHLNATCSVINVNVCFDAVITGSIALWIAALCLVHSKIIFCRQSSCFSRVKKTFSVDSNVFHPTVKLICVFELFMTWVTMYCQAFPKNKTLVSAAEMKTVFTGTPKTSNPTGASTMQWYMVLKFIQTILWLIILKINSQREIFHIHVHCKFSQVDQWDSWKVCEIYYCDMNYFV